MKKLKLIKSEVLDSALTREQLKGIIGGSSSGSYSGSVQYGCAGKKEGDKCKYKKYNGGDGDGICKYLPFSYGLTCWGG